MIDKINVLNLFDDNEEELCFPNSINAVNKCTEMFLKKYNFSAIEKYKFLESVTMGLKANKLDSYLIKDIENINNTFKRKNYISFFDRKEDNENDFLINFFLKNSINILTKDNGIGYNKLLFSSNKCKIRKQNNLEIMELVCDCVDFGITKQEKEGLMNLLYVPTLNIKFENNEYLLYIDLKFYKNNLEHLNPFMPNFSIKCSSGKKVNKINYNSIVNFLEKEDIKDNEKIHLNFKVNEISITNNYNFKTEENKTFLKKILETFKFFNLDITTYDLENKHKISILEDDLDIDLELTSFKKYDILVGFYDE